MRSEDRPCFAAAAAHFHVWILVRRTNPDSLKYIGMPGYAPKPIDCKAKTADRDIPGKKLAGLVVAPTIHSGAFRQSKLSKVDAEWRKFTTADGRLPPGYKNDEDKKSLHYGCVMKGNEYLHGDYDLYDIVLPKHVRGNIAAVETMNGVPHFRSPRFLKVQEFINSMIGSPVVQHCGHMQYADHSDDTIDVFGPAGEQFSLNNKYAVEKLYEHQFEGRQPIVAP